MNILMDGEGRLERNLMPEPVVAPALGSFALHGALAGCLVFYALFAGLFHHNTWGSAGAGGAMQVSLVSSALPLPADQPPNQNVLATDTPSPAPAAPAPKAKEAIDETAIPILGKPKKPQPQPVAKNPQRVPQADNRAQYGEQAGSQMARATAAQIGPIGPATVSGGDFGSRFPWYVDGINRKMSASWYKPEVDPRTPKGARVYLIFSIRKDGTPADVQIDRSSGSTTLDRSCQRGAQRVDSFGNLPAGYNQSTLNVSYYCEY